MCGQVRHLCFGVAAESAKSMVGLSGGGWVLKFSVKDLANVGKVQQVFL